MDHKSTNKALAFSLSIFFHAAFVCTAAFLPLYLSETNSAKNIDELEVAVVGEGIAPETGAATADQLEIPAAPAEAVAPAPQIVPTAKAQVTVTKTVRPIPKPIEAIKARPKTKPAQPAPKRVMVAESEEESQPIIEVGESLNEDGVNTIEQAQEEVPVTSAPIEVAAQPAAATTAPIAASATAPSATTAAPAATAAAPASASSAQGTGEVASASQPQNFLSLKQAGGNRPPSYPREARLQKAEGKGQLAYYVSKDGKVTDIKVNKSSGVPALDEAALAAFSKYKFVPGQEGYTVHNFEFTLQGPAEPEGLKLRTTYQEKNEPSRPATLR